MSANYNEEAYANYPHLSKMMKSAPNREYTAPDPTKQAPGSRRLNAYETLVNLVLDHKMELQKIPMLGSMYSAQQYLDDHNMSKRYSVKYADVNGDNIKDVVVWNKKTQQPYTVNGYKLKRSDWATRDAYYKDHATADRRDEESYQDWKTSDNLWNTTISKTNPFNRMVEANSDMKAYINDGWKISKRPQKSITPYTVFCHIAKPVLESIVDGVAFKTLIAKRTIEKLCAANGIGVEIGDNSIKLFNRIVSPILLYRTLYNAMVDRLYYFKLYDDNKVRSLVEFKRYISRNPNRFNTWFTKQYLKHSNGVPILDTNNDFISNGRITVEKLWGNLVDGEINVDGSDVNDTIVFLFGVNNSQNKEFLSIIGHESDAYQFLYNLTHGDKAEKANAKKMLRIVKADAKKSYQELTVNRKNEYYSTNSKAAQEYINIRDAGLDTSAGTLNMAQHDADANGIKEDVPPSPPKQPPQKNSYSQQDRAAAMAIINIILSSNDWNKAVEQYKSEFDTDKLLEIVTKVNEQGPDALDMDEFEDSKTDFLE
jgi:hypothetical protein